MLFKDHIVNRIQSKPEAKFFRRTYGNLRFDKRKVINKKMKGVAEADLITLTQSNGAAPSTLFPKNDQTHRLVVDYFDLKNNLKIHVDLFQELMTRLFLCKRICFFFER